MVLISAVVVVCVAVVVTVVVLTRRSTEPAADTAGTATVGESGVDLAVDGIVVHGPPGVAPVGTVLTVSYVQDPPAGRALELARGAGRGISLTLGGLQPAQPLVVTLPIAQDPLPGEAAVVITKPADGADTRLVPATYAAAAHTVTAEVDHLSWFWPAFLDFGKVRDVLGRLLGQTTGITSPRPDCAGKPTATATGTPVSMSGDYAPGSHPIAWPCLRVEQNRVVATLTSNSPLPWRIRAAPNATLDEQGTVDVSKAAVLAAYHTLVTHRPYAEALLIPGTSMTYRFPEQNLPATIAGHADVGTYLGMSLLFGIQTALEVFGVELGDIGKSADALTCLGNAVETANLAAKPNVDAVAGFAKSMLACFTSVLEGLGAKGNPLRIAKVVIGIIGTGIGLVVAGLQGALLTALGKDTFSLDITAPRPASDLHKANLRDITVPAALCHTTKDFRLHNATATSLDSASGLLDAGTTGNVIFGDLDGDHRDEAAVDVFCNYQGGNGIPGQGYVILTGTSGTPTPLGIVTAQYQPPRTYLTAVETITIAPNKIVAREDYYRDGDSHCCPSGHATTTWTYTNGKLAPGRPQLTG